MSDYMKFVDFHKWCPKCKYFDEPSDETHGDVCDVCLAIVARDETAKPERFEEA